MMTTQNKPGRVEGHDRADFFQNKTPVNNTISDRSALEFLQEITQAGGGTPEVLPDGQIHRFAGEDDRQGCLNWWYVFYGMSGAFGSWKLGFKQTWHGGNRSKEDDAALARQIKAAKRQRNEDLVKNQKKAQETACYLWAEGAEIIDHQYLKNKQITPYGIRQKDNQLLIPMLFQDEIWNIQQIQPDGIKRFLKGGRVNGCYMPIGTMSDHFFICEGYATGCSLHEHYHNCDSVIVTFTAGNLKHVAKTVRDRYPDIRITIAADNDVGTPGNPGLTKGREAATAVDGYLTYPDFADLEIKGTDFNDYVNAGGVLCL